MLYVNSERLWGRINDLAQVGAIDGTMGCSRLALTDEDAEARRLVITWMQDLGMDIAIDGIGNVVGTWYGPDTDRDLPAVMTGSHIDTVKTGGRFDGNLGVLAGLEVIETIAEQGLSPAHRPQVRGGATSTRSRREAAGRGARPRRSDGEANQGRP